jgi:hypothetical protein
MRCSLFIGFRMSQNKKMPDRYPVLIFKNIKEEYMRRKLYTILLAITLTAFAMTISDIALAYPSKGSDCSQCHKSKPTPPPPSNIASVQGDWDVTVVEKMKVKVKGEKADFTAETYNDVFSFESNNEFYMFGKYFGTWQQAGKTYIVNIDPQAFSEHVMGLENSEGLQSITVTHSSFKAKVNKDGTIKGTIIVKAVFEADNTPGKFNLISKFTGSIQDN